MEASNCRKGMGSLADEAGAQYLSAIRDNAGTMRLQSSTWSKACSSTASRARAQYRTVNSAGSVEKSALTVGLQSAPVSPSAMGERTRPTTYLSFDIEPEDPELAPLLAVPPTKPLEHAVRNSFASSEPSLSGLAALKSET